MVEQDPSSEAPSHWIFQANPERYDLREELEPGATEGWLASRYATRMRPGDVVWLWRSGERAIYGWGTLAGQAERNARDGRFWVPVEYQVRFAEPLELGLLRSQADLADLTILRAPQGTNFTLTTDQARALVELARGRGLEAPEPPEGREMGPFVPVGRSPLLGRLFQRLKGRSMVVSRVVQCVDLLAALFAEGQSATAVGEREPATIWLHQTLAPTRQNGGDTETEGSPRVSILQSLPNEPRFYDAEVLVPYPPGVETVGDVFSKMAAGVVEKAALIQAAAEGPVEDPNQPLEGRLTFDYALVAALLFSDLPGVRAVLAEERQSPSALGDSFLAQTERVFRAGASARWRRFVRLPGAYQALANFAADRPEGEDALEIEPDIRAFASVIAARAVRPPLSIGLFGDWGSGKSFFMHRLRQQIADLSTSATRPSETDPGVIEEDPDSPFWPNIVQVEFNAWHYVESNLWASLVAHLFNSLAKLEKKAQAAQRARHETLIKDLNVAAALQQRLQEERHAALSHLRRTELLARGFRRRREEQRRKLTKLELLRSIPWQQVAELALDKMTVEKASKGDLAALEKLHGDIEGEIEETKRLGERAGRLVDAAWSLGGETVLWLIAVIALAVGAFFLAKPMIEKGTLGAALTALLASLVPLLGWFRRLRGKATAALAVLEHTKTNIERAALIEPSAEERQAAEELAQLEAALRRTEEQARQAAERVEDASAALTEFRTTSSVAHFLEERAVSGDYREQLGLLALIRNDFEELSRRLRSSRGEGVGEEAAPAPLPVSDPNRIDRIVLFIDDLDRCPPERVFEVLEAIHLLLAFDLFVVIVGVDERWLSRALAMARAGLLARSGAEGAKLLQTLGIQIEDTASPSDFLEKIFQIPFWLRPIDRQDFGRLVDQLVARDLPQTSNTGDKPEQPQPSGSMGPGAGQTPGSEGGAGPQPAGRALGLENAIESEAEKILIEPFERDCMRDLSTIVGRSPRTAKAFVNIWRVLKGRESIARSLAPLRQEESCGGLLLLALVVGNPNGAGAILDLIKSAQPQRPVRDLFPDVSPASLVQAGVSPTLYGELASVTQRHLGDLSASTLQTWLPTVRRFSFSAEVAHDPTHIDLFRRVKASNGPRSTPLEQTAVAAK